MYGYTKLDPKNCEFLAIGSVEDLPNGERLFVEIDGQSIVVFNIAGAYFAIADVCSHDDGPLGDGRLEGFEIICPRHGARFDVRNGEVLALPAVIDIQSYPVRTNKNQIEIGMPKLD